MGEAHQCRHRRRGGGEGSPASARDQRHRHQQAEMRLVAQQPEQQAGAGGAAVDQPGETAEQRRGEERVLPQPDGPEHRGKRQDRGQPLPAPALGPTGLQHGTHGQQKQDPGWRPGTGRRRRNRVGWRAGRRPAGRPGVGEILVAGAGPCRLLLRRPVRRVVVGERRRARHCQLARGVKTGEIAGRRVGHRHEYPVLPQRQEHDDQQLRGEQDRGPGGDAIPRQPRGTAQRLEPRARGVRRDRDGHEGSRVGRWRCCTPPGVWNGCKELDRDAG